jgi:MYXO-CTERM domain-containing protein
MGTSLLVAVLALAPQQLDPRLGAGTLPGDLTINFADNSSCRSCHWESGNTTMPYGSYRGSMMDLAGVDPVFLASLEIAYNDVEISAQLCIRCHYPKAWLDGRGQGAPAQDFGLLTSDFQGVQCDYCHRMDIPPPLDPQDVDPNSIVDPALSGILISNAQSYIADSTAKRGPLDIVGSGFHETIQSPLFEDSIICAQCHDVSNTFLELRDDAGDTLGIPVPIERTYTEWRDSAFSDVTSPDYRSCMDCHMDTYDGKTATFGEDRVDLHSHEIVGANAMVPAMVAYLYNDGQDYPFLAGIQAEVPRITAKVSEQLGRAATLEAVEVVDGAGGKALRMRVTNDTGHKLPTGYAEGRRMFIAHDVVRADGTQGPKSGTIDTATWDYVEGSEPAREWEILVAEGLSPDSSFHFVQVDRLLQDNRIPPRGFIPRIDTPVVGHDYPVQPDGTLAHWDEVDLPLGDDDCWPAVVDVTLDFQASSGPYLDFLIANAPVYGPALGDALAAVGAAPVNMETVKVAVFEDGTIEDYAGPYACTPVDPPVVDAGQPDPPEVDAGVEPPPGPPLGNNGPPPGQQDDEPPTCSAHEVSSSRAPLAAFALLGLVALLRRRRR